MHISATTSGAMKLLQSSHRSYFSHGLAYRYALPGEKSGRNLAVRIPESGETPDICNQKRCTMVCVGPEDDDGPEDDEKNVSKVCCLEQLADIIRDVDNVLNKIRIGHCCIPRRLLRLLPHYVTIS